MEGLNFNNILGNAEIDNLFSEPEETAVEETTAENPNGDNSSSKEKISETDNTTEVEKSEELFDEGTDAQPESVGSEDETKEQGDTTTSNGGSSPQNFYSSIANAMAVDGIFPNLDEEAVKKVVDAESFSDLIEAEINARYEEGQQRILNALKEGVEPDDIRKYEGTLNYLSTLTEQNIAAESPEGEELRRNLIYQDYLNRGMSQEKARKLTERSIDSGNDVEDAKEALQSNRDFFQGKYNKLLEDAHKKAEESKATQKKQAEKLKESLLKDKVLMGDLDISSDVRKKAFDAISKPVYRDPDSGTYMTAIQRYEMEHKAEFLKYVGLFYTMTDGFKDFESFTKGKVKKAVRQGLRELEQTLNGTRRSSDGTLKQVTSISEDPDAFIGNFKLAL